jgi:hypothetical protein
LADNIIAKANTGTGTEVLAAKEIAGVLYPKTILTDGVGAEIGSGNPLPVSITTALEITNDSGNPVPVNATNLPLPAGASTEATLAVVRSELEAIDSYFKAEDAPAVSGDKGLLFLAMRQLADTTSTDADGDYTALKIDEEGRAKVSTKPASFPIVTGNITANAQTVFCDVSRASNVMIAMVATSLVGHNSTFEGSIDSTNGTDGNWFGIQVIRSNANTIELVTGVLAATPAYAWEASVNGLSFIRVRATAHTSGTAAWKFQRGSYATEPIPGAQISGTQPVSGTLTSAGTTTNTPVTPTTTFTNSVATTNATSIKATAGTLWSIVVSNVNAAARFVKVYNLATAPTVGTSVPAFTIAVPANGTVTVSGGANGIRFATGISLAITVGAADSDTAAVAANDVKVATTFT